jgi:hypothetical protein
LTIPNLPPPSYEETKSTIFRHAVIFLSEGIDKGNEQKNPFELLRIF